MSADNICRYTKRLLMSDNYKNDNMPRDAQFLRLLMSSREKVYAYILSHVHNSNDAEDIMQDAITVMWRKYDSFEPGYQFYGMGFYYLAYVYLKIL